MGLLELPVILCQVRHQYSQVVRVYVAEEGQHSGSGVASERVLEGEEVSVLKCLDELKGNFNVTTFILLLTLFGMLA